MRKSERKPLVRTLVTTDIESAEGLDTYDRLAFYSGLDCMLTLEVALAQRKLFDSVSLATYRFMFGLQRPALKMFLRGTLVDPHERERMLLILRKAISWCEHVANTYGMALWGKPFNPGSPQQKAELLYSVLKLPAQHSYNKHRGTAVTTNREALEKLLSLSFRAEPVLRVILAYQDAKKAESVLKSGIERDGRLRALFVVAGPVTGRFASRKNMYNRGMNLQNVREKWRVVFTTEWGPMKDRKNFSIPDEFRDLQPVED